MYVRTLQLTNYRNFRRLALTLGDGPTIVQAPNAQGKTNLLEAIELLATTKSIRAGSDRELIHWAALGGEGDGLGGAEPFGRISAVVGHERGEIHADVILRVVESPGPAAGPAVSKTLRLNGLPRRAAEFVGEINVVSFSPEDVALVAGPPTGRRRYLDVTNAQMSRRYLRALQRYHKVLIQRNHLLRHLHDHGQMDPTLSAWDGELARDGAFLLQERARLVAGLNEVADRWFRELGGWGQQLAIRYRPGVDEATAEALRSVPTETDEALGRIHSRLSRALESVAARERSVGMSLVGPHRDDLSFLVDGVDLNVYGSRGQQRLVALSLKLAELDLLRARVGSRPILLLDDALSELDEQKQKAVLRVASGSGQTLLTVTGLDAVDSRALPDAGLIRLQGGALVDSQAPRPQSAPTRGGHAGPEELEARQVGLGTLDSK